MSETISVGSYWPGFSGIDHLIIFGDSYSDVGRSIFLSKGKIRSTQENPLGVEFPGLTFAEPNKPNWVGHLITEFKPNPSILVHCFAVGGDTVHGVVKQVQRDFLPGVGTQPDWAQWTSSNSLFVTWVGINDCAFMSGNQEEYAKECMNTVFEQQAVLYGLGARNFLFIDVPPIERSPAVPRATPKVASKYQLWNQTLRQAVEAFTSSKQDTTAIICSSYATFTRVLDNPGDFGFKEGDQKKRNGTIWVDHLHPTSKMHHEIARDVSTLLSSIEAKPKT